MLYIKHQDTLGYAVYAKIEEINEDYRLTEFTPYEGKAELEKARMIKAYEEREKAWAVRVKEARAPEEAAEKWIKALAKKKIIHRVDAHTYYDRQKAVQLAMAKNAELRGLMD